MKPCNPSGTLDIIAEEDVGLPPEKQTLFEVTQLSMEEFAFCQNLSVQGLTGSLCEAVLNLGLSGARNFFDPQGEQIVFKRDESKPPIVGKKKPWMYPILTYIPPKERDHLAAIIYKGVGLGEQQAKNS